MTFRHQQARPALNLPRNECDVCTCLRVRGSAIFVYTLGYGQRTVVLYLVHIVLMSYLDWQTAHCLVNLMN